jgi:hypothetical protein
MDLEAISRPLEPPKKKKKAAPKNSRNEASKSLLFESRPRFLSEIAIESFYPAVSAAVSP